MANDPSYERAHANLLNNTCDLRVEFVKHMMEVKSKRIWDDEELTDVNDREESPSMNEDDDEDEGFIEDYITPGGIIRLPVNKHTKSIRAMYVRQKNEEKSSYVRSMQKKLCRVLSLCDQVSTVNIDITKTKDLYGYSYIELKISEDARALLNATSIDFEVQIELDNKQLVRKRFSLNCPPRRQKRWKEYTKFTAWGVTSIPGEHYFPYYWQHEVTRGRKNCLVGCGSVAWAMVFGYYDRRSHAEPYIYGNGSQYMYRCGADGTYGSSHCEAPKYAYKSYRLRMYINKISYAVGTFCWRGVSFTPAFRMDRVKGFFRSLMRYGNPTIRQTNDVWKIIHRKKFAEKTRKWIRDGWPVVVGTREGGIKRHYPVATKYRYKYRKYRRCWRFFGKRCARWHKLRHFQMYTHEGKVRSSVKWRAMTIHYAAIAPY